MSSPPTTTPISIPAPTNTINPLPATPAEAAAVAAVAAAASRPGTSGTALDLHSQTEDAARQYKDAQKAEKAYGEKKKCMSARKDWYDCKVHFAAGVQGFRQGGKCVGRVVKAGPYLVKEKVMGVKGKGVKGVDSASTGSSAVLEKEKADKKDGNRGVKAKVMELKEKLLAVKEKRTAKKNAKANETGATTRAATTAEAVVVTAAPIAATPAPAPAPTKQEKKRMTLDQVRDRIISYRRSHFISEDEDEDEVTMAPRIAENPTRRSQSARKAGSGSLSRRRGSGGRGSSGANTNTNNVNANNNIPNIDINEQPTAVTTEDAVESSRITNENNHGTHSRGQGNNSCADGDGTNGERREGRAVSESSGVGSGSGSSSRNGEVVGLKARIAFMVRGRLRGGDTPTSVPSPAGEAVLSENGDGGEETKTKKSTTKKSTKEKIVAHFKQHSQWIKCEKLNHNEKEAGSKKEKRLSQTGNLSTLKLRSSLFISKMRDVGGNAMGWVGGLVVEGLAGVSGLREGVRGRVGGGKEGGKKGGKVRFSRWSKGRVF
ncbi:hypothetical protein EAF04_002621 [Stromatinia cepivora]|nr:hypothetical protein EAF04_002621 [Stromatinia cepivora]